MLRVGHPPNKLLIYIVMFEKYFIDIVFNKFIILKIAITF